MSAYVLLTNGEKDGIVSPTVIGPFESYEAAETFIDPDTKSGKLIWNLERSHLDTYGGYAATIIVSDLSAENPEEWVEDYADIFGEEE